MRVLALALFRLRGAMTARVLLAPIVALVLLQLIGLAGGPQPAAVLLVTSVCLSLPALAWLSRQILNAEPDDQVLLSSLAVGGAVAETTAGLLAAQTICVPLAVASSSAALLRADGQGVPAEVLLYGLVLTLVTTLAAVGIGAFASRSIAGSGGVPVVVLLAVPVLIAVLSLSRHALITALVPRLGTAVRVTQDPPFPITPNDYFVQRAAPILVQILLWSVAVLSLRLLLARRRT